MLFHAALVAALVALPCSWAKVFGKCELARELLYVHGFPEDQIPQWVCIAEHESQFNSSAVGHMNWDGSADHGLFQNNVQMCGAVHSITFTSFNEHYAPCASAWTGDSSLQEALDTECREDYTKMYCGRRLQLCLDGQSTMSQRNYEVAAQINDRYWCSPPGPKNECYIDCADLEDDNITDDVECVRLIYKRHGFSAWAVWRGLCRGVNYSNYLNECISGKVGVVNSVLWNYGRK